MTTFPYPSGCTMHRKHSLYKMGVGFAIHMDAVLQSIKNIDALFKQVSALNRLDETTVSTIMSNMLVDELSESTLECYKHPETKGHPDLLPSYLLSPRKFEEVGIDVKASVASTDCRAHHQHNKNLILLCISQDSNNVWQISMAIGFFDLTQDDWGTVHSTANNNSTPVCSLKKKNLDPYILYVNEHLDISKFVGKTERSLMGSKVNQFYLDNLGKPYYAPRKKTKKDSSLPLDLDDNISIMKETSGSKT